MLAAAPAALAAELSETGEFLDGVAAIVNEGVVLRSQFNEQLGDGQGAGRCSRACSCRRTTVLEEQILERLIVTEIQLQRAERIGLGLHRFRTSSSMRPLAENRKPERLAFRGRAGHCSSTDGIEYAQISRGRARRTDCLNELKSHRCGSAQYPRLGARDQPVHHRPRKQRGRQLRLGAVAHPADDPGGRQRPRRYRKSSRRPTTFTHGCRTMPTFVNSPHATPRGRRRSKAARWAGCRDSRCRRCLPTFYRTWGPATFTAPFRTANSSFHIVKVDNLRSAVERSRNQPGEDTPYPDCAQRDHRRRHGETAPRGRARENPRRRGLRRAGETAVRRPGLCQHRRRPGLGGNGRLCTGIQGRRRRGRHRRRHRTLPHDVRLAHPRGHRPPRLRQHRRTQGAQLRCAYPPRQAGRGDAALDAAHARRSVRRHAHLGPADTRVALSKPLVVTAGEPAGIGPEICSALANSDFARDLVVIGDARLLDDRLQVLDTPYPAPLSNPVKPDPRTSPQTLLDGLRTAGRRGLPGAVSYSAAWSRRPLSKSVIADSRDYLSLGTPNSWPS